MERVSLEDIKFMNLAVREAYRGKGKTLPNPAVGAVLVKNGRVISTGYHERAGLPHAEAVAIERAGSEAKGGKMSKLQKAFRFKSFRDLKIFTRQTGRSMRSGQIPFCLSKINGETYFAEF